MTYSKAQLAKIDQLDTLAAARDLDVDVWNAYKRECAISHVMPTFADFLAFERLHGDSVEREG